MCCLVEKEMWDGERSARARQGLHTINEPTPNTQRMRPTIRGHNRDQTIELAADAIRGHRSAHSLATGPVMADPFISPFGLTITPALSSK